MACRGRPCPVCGRGAAGASRRGRTVAWVTPHTSRNGRRAGATVPENAPNPGGVMVLHRCTAVGDRPLPRATVAAPVERPSRGCPGRRRAGVLHGRAAVGATARRVGQAGGLAGTAC